MATYSKCTNRDILDVAEALRAEFHPDLERFEVTVGYMFAYASRDAEGQPKGPALHRQGVAAAAEVCITPLKLRALGIPDAVITLDGDNWRKWPEATLRAVLDHELHHIEVVKEEGTNVCRSDDLGRPKLKLRPHDFEVWGFDLIVARHGAAAMETRAIEQLKARKFQATFSFGPSDSEATPSPRISVSVRGLHIGELAGA